MKRTITSFLVVTTAIVILGLVMPWSRLNSRMIVLAVVVMAIGFLISRVISMLVFKVVGSERGSMSIHTRRVAWLTEALAGIMFAIFANYLLNEPIRRILYSDISPKQFNRVDEFLGVMFFWLLIISTFYVLLRLYEETLGQRVKTHTGLSFRNGGWKLLLKLGVAGFILYLPVSIVSNDAHVKGLQYRLHLASSGEREKDSTIGIIQFVTTGFGHQRYLEFVLQLSNNLKQRKAKAVLVPLPTQLQLTRKNIELLKAINSTDIVVFAVPPEWGLGMPQLQVEDPAKGTFKLDWGVLSAVKLEDIPFLTHKYFPLAFKETRTGARIPDAALLALQKYRLPEQTALIADDGPTVTFGTENVHLYKDHSAPVHYKFFAQASDHVWVFGGEESDTLRYSDLNGTPSPGRVDVLDNFANRIVLIEPGYDISTLWSFSYSYSQIIHQHLRGDTLLPLDLWTPVFIAIFIFLAALAFAYFRPWSASLIVIAVTVGLAYLSAWMTAHDGVLLEYIPLLFSGVGSVIFFVFVRINHERSMLLVAEKQRALQELQTARDMQMGLMPKEDPSTKGFDISGICVPAKEVGGDFYDYVWLDKKKTKLGITIADVSGKSMKAAMTAVMTSGMLYSEVAKSQSPRDILARINRPLYLRTDKRVFTTMALAVIDVKKRGLVYSSAGHLPPLIVQKNAVHYLKAETTGLPLGIQEELVYKEARVKLQRGDRAIFYTDGISEAMNEQKEQYGNERLEALVKNNALVSAKDIRDKILADVSAFTGGAEQHDDMTVVVVKVL